MFHVANNCGTCVIFAYSLAETGNASLIGVINHGAELYLTFFIEQ